MKFLSLLCGALVLPLAAAAPAVALDGGAAVDAALVENAAPGLLSGVVSNFLPGVSLNRSQPDVQLAQASDPRVVGLEEQIRQLNGRMEEMNFQILQMQEQMRKMQEDVDFRLQDLEQKRGDAGTSGATVKAAEAPAPSRQEQVAAAPQGAPAGGPGAPERPLGSIVFDGQGNVKGGTLDPKALESATTDSQTVAALPATDDPQELYRNSYEHILSGDYGTAEAGFRRHIESFPADPQAADARYWLGEALLGQQRYRDAAEIFVAANREFPDARKSPDMLLKLGVSLAALNQRDVACATFGKINQRYPRISASLKERVKQEQALAGC